MNQIEQLQAAIAILEQASAAFAKRIAHNDEETRELSMERKHYLVASAEILVPNLSRQTLLTLIAQLPAFASTQIQLVFVQNHKTLGLFKGARYQQQLGLMRARVSAEIDRTHYGDLRKLDKNIDTLSQETSLITAKRMEAADLIHIIQQAIQAGIALSPAQQAQIERIIQHPKIAHSRRPKSSATESNPQDGSNDDDYDLDIWFYLLTDIPTSFRTLMLDAVNSHRLDDIIVNNREEQSTNQRHTENEDSGKSGNIDALSSEQHTPSTYNPSHIPSAHIAGGVALVAGGILLAENQIEAIATDDSLGHFS